LGAFDLWAKKANCLAFAGGVEKLGDVFEKFIF